MLTSRSCVWPALALGLVGIWGCGRVNNTVLTEANYIQRFDQIEAISREQAGELKVGDLPALLGPGETVTADHPDLAGGPPGVAQAARTWSRWERGHEVLLIGSKDERVTSVVRLRR